MQALLSESVAELLALVFYGVVASGLTAVGALAEQAGLQNLAVGQATLGLWEAGVGLLFLYAGLSVAREFVLPRVSNRS